ncbi:MULTISPECIES: Hpt domain-containing protein [unclassified Adlercreutzia]|uniref:Hpt domain-containing protein n=1 Tax=unclassified Adlercreutzia TaxID=2636013 RepID=UPI0013E9E101|nr:MULTISPECIES: Hpt domain-containing protein [unclassified Adlercreutzia]
MTLESCYAMMGGDLEGVRGRLLTDERVAKFVGMFPHDDTFANLERAMEAHALEDAFRAAHTLKGVSHDLGFMPLHVAADELTQALRPVKEGGAVDEAALVPLMEAVQDAYRTTIDALATVNE